MPLAARALLAAVGVAVVLVAGRSLVATVVVPRRLHSFLPVAVDRGVDALFHLLGHLVRDDEHRQRMFAGQAPATLLLQLAAWLVSFLVGFALLLLPWSRTGPAAGFGPALTVSGSALFTLGFAAPRGAAPVAVVDVAALTGLVSVALQIGYLPTLYAAFNRRETEVTLLYARAGLPAWGPELLARTKYGFPAGSALAALPDLYDRWERWAADVAESHAAYPPLMRFRSPTPLGSWVTALLAVLDSAALFLAVAPADAPALQARLCLRMGFTCFRELAAALGHPVPDDPDPNAGIALPYPEFAESVERLRSVGFPVRRGSAEAWPDFVGWRVNYEQAAYALAAELDAPPALWSGPRRDPVPPLPPARPANRSAARDGKGAALRSGPPRR